MAKLKLSEGGFSVIPKGEHIFKITKSTYDATFGKLEVEMVTAQGQKHTERYSLTKDDGSVNEGANNAWSYFAKVALNNFNLDEIDTDDIVGCYIKCMVDHDLVPSKKDPSKTLTFAKLTDKSPASGFDNTTAGSVGTAPTPLTTGTVNLDDLLG